MPAGGLVTAGVIGLGEAAVGFFKEKSAAKKAKQLAATRPKLQSSPYLKDQIALAESDLSTGMSADAKRAYQQETDADQSSSIGAITRMGGSPNDVGSIFAKSQNGRARLAIMRDNLRLNQINNLTRAQDANEESRQQQFQFNQFAPWADEAQANAQAKAAGQSEIFSGLSTAAGGAMRYGEGVNSSNQFKQYLSAVTKGSGGGGGNTNAGPEPAAASASPTLDSALDQIEPT